MGLTGRMLGREVQGREVVEVVFNVWAIGDGKYALLLGVVVAVVLGAMNLLGADVATKMGTVGTAIKAAP